MSEVMSVQVGRFRATVMEEFGKPIIYFYDMKEFSSGHFTGANYHLHTFLSHKGSLNLHGAVPEWTLTEWQMHTLKVEIIGQLYGIIG